jgi:hypothetical protein
LRMLQVIIINIRIGNTSNSLNYSVVSRGWLRCYVCQQFLVGLACRLLLPAKNCFATIPLTRY